MNIDELKDEMIRMGGSGTTDIHYELDMLLLRYIDDVTVKSIYETLLRWCR